jgi:hypothetical protein
MPQEPKDSIYMCKICMRQMDGRTGLIEHLRTEHESLEVVSFAATTMVQEQERDKSAMEFHRQFEQIKKELTAG